MRAMKAMRTISGGTSSWNDASPTPAADAADRHQCRGRETFYPHFYPLKVMETQLPPTTPDTSCPETPILIKRVLLMLHAHPGRPLSLAVPPGMRQLEPRTPKPLLLLVSKWGLAVLVTCTRFQLAGGDCRVSWTTVNWYVECCRRRSIPKKWGGSGDAYAGKMVLRRG
jgi:hypothetical protein